MVLGPGVAYSEMGRGELSPSQRNHPRSGDAAMAMLPETQAQPLAFVNRSEAKRKPFESEERYCL